MRCDGDVAAVALAGANETQCVVVVGTVRAEGHDRGSASLSDSKGGSQGAVTGAQQCRRQRARRMGRVPGSIRSEAGSKGAAHGRVETVGQWDGGTVGRWDGGTVVAGVERCEGSRHDGLDWVPVLETVLAVPTCAILAAAVEAPRSSGSLPSRKPRALSRSLATLLPASASCQMHNAVWHAAAYTSPPAQFARPPANPHGRRTLLAADGLA
jgi:hypothetical protein